MSTAAIWHKSKKLGSIHHQHMSVGYEDVIFVAKSLRRRKNARRMMARRAAKMSDGYTSDGHIQKPIRLDKSETTPPAMPPRAALVKKPTLEKKRARLQLSLLSIPNPVVVFKIEKDI